MLSENIRAARKARGLSQEELAARLNVVRQTISKWEQGLSVPDADLLIGLSEDEVSNFQLVVDQYLKPLQYGLVEDVEAGLQTFRDKAEEAGVSKIQEEYTRQYTEWLANNK